MDLEFAVDGYDVLAVHLRDGADRASVTVHPATPGVESLLRAIDGAMANGYGECFWPGWEGGQYWWIFKRDAAAMEVIAMWTRGGAALWEHVFRATADAAWLRDRVVEAAARIITA